MNLRFRINQIKNAFFFKEKRSYKWIFIYGVPRSGTTYFYQELLQLSKFGVSDYDLGKFIPVMNHIQQSDYIPIDNNELKKFLSKQLLIHAAPGGGNEYEFIVKQVNTNLEEYQLLCELMGSEPAHKYFLFREPIGWLPSAMKKFALDAGQAETLYRMSFNSYSEIGGEKIEYGQEITEALTNLKIAPSITFNSNENNSAIEKNISLKNIYDKNKKG